MKKIQKKIIAVLIPMLVLMVLCAPVLASAATKYKLGDPIVPVCQTPNPAGGQYCGWGDFLQLVNNVITFIFVGLAVPICGIMFAYAGFKLVTAGSESGRARETAKSTFTNAAIGLALAAASWLIIRSILVLLGYNGSWIGF